MLPCSIASRTLNRASFQTLGEQYCDLPTRITQRPKRRAHYGLGRLSKQPTVRITVKFVIAWMIRLDCLSATWNLPQGNRGTNEDRVGAHCNGGVDLIGRDRERRRSLR